MKLRNQALRSLTGTTGKWKHLSAVSAACLLYIYQSLSQHYLGCCLWHLQLMEILVCGACGMPTVHAPVTASALSGMLLTALTANGNTCLPYLRHVYGTCHSRCASTVWEAYGHIEIQRWKNCMFQSHMQKGTLDRSVWLTASFAACPSCT